MGLINLSLDTMEATPFMAMNILVVYTLVVVMCSAIAYVKKWKLKL